MSAADYLPSSRSLRTLSRAARDCQGCELYKRATQTVFGAGRAGARSSWWANSRATNAVKHFKWEPRGKRRLHKKPSARPRSDTR